MIPLLTEEPELAIASDGDELGEQSEPTGMSCPAGQGDV
jgi:hypothetical protein